jgi:hypothetical protein
METGYNPIDRSFQQVSIQKLTGEVLQLYPGDFSPDPRQGRRTLRRHSSLSA